MPASREDRAKQEVFEAVRFLAPDELHKLFKDLADATEKLGEEYDNRLADILLS